MLRKARRDVAIKGQARVDPRTKDLIPRLKPGEIAVIDHEDLDEVSAVGLVERRAAAVINAGTSISGRYPNSGPLVLARAGIPIVDAAGKQVMELIREGDQVRIEGGRVFRGEDEVALGESLDAEEIERRLELARASLGEELEKFVANTMSYLEREGDLILRGEGMPETRTRFAGRHALVVVRGYDYKDDLRALRGYMTDYKPVLVAVDGAADALLEEGLKPDMIIGDMDSVSAEALTCGAEVVVHAYPDGSAPGLDRVTGLDIEPKLFPTSGTSEDIAMLIAFERGAELIVAVGAHTSLVEFLDKGRGGMASTFLVRLKVGPKLVDAKGVNRLYRKDISRGLLLLLVGSAFAAMFIALSMAPGVGLFIENMGERISDFWFRIRRIF